jgi:hypothetical protein
MLRATDLQLRIELMHIEPHVWRAGDRAGNREPWDAASGPASGDGLDR